MREILVYSSIVSDSDRAILNFKVDAKTNLERELQALRFQSQQLRLTIKALEALQRIRKRGTIRSEASK